MLLVYIRGYDVITPSEKQRWQPCLAAGPDGNVCRGSTLYTVFPFVCVVYVRGNSVDLFERPIVQAAVEG